MYLQFFLFHTNPLTTFWCNPDNKPPLTGTTYNFRDKSKRLHSVQLTGIRKVLTLENVKWPTALARQKCPGARRIQESVLTGVSFPSHATTTDICSRLIDTAIKKRWEHHTSWQRYVKIKVKSFWSHTGPQSGNNLSLCGPHSHTNLHCRDFNLSLTWLNYSEKVVVCFYFNVLANCSVSQIKK